MLPFQHSDVDLLCIELTTNKTQTPHKSIDQSSNFKDTLHISTPSFNLFVSEPWSPIDKKTKTKNWPNLIAIRPPWNIRRWINSHVTNKDSHSFLIPLNTYIIFLLKTRTFFWVLNPTQDGAIKTTSHAFKKKLVMIHSYELILPL